MLSNCRPAVEQLIALGADIRVIKDQHSMFEWEAEGAPCRLSQLGAESFWMDKMNNLCLMQAAREAVFDSLFELIHLAVRWECLCHSFIVSSTAYGSRSGHT